MEHEGGQGRLTPRTNIFFPGPEPKAFGVGVPPQAASLPRLPCSVEQAQGSLAPVPSPHPHPPRVSAEVTQILISAPSFAHMENTFHNTHQQRGLGRLKAVFIMCFELKSSECKVYYC